MWNLKTKMVTVITGATGTIPNSLRKYLGSVLPRKSRYHNSKRNSHSGFGGLEVACWSLASKFAASNPVEAVGFFRAKKILSTPSFGREVKPFVPCRIFEVCKRTMCMRGSRSFRSKLPAISRSSSSSFHY